MKYNHGFTLIELLTVITIIAFLGIIVGTSVTSTIVGVRKDTSKAQEKNILSAAKNWGAENIYSLPSDGNSIVISLHDLMAGGYITGDKENQIVDMETGQTISKLETLITITNQGGDYTYHLKKVYGKDSLSLNAPIVILRGKEEEEVTGTYDDPGVIAYNNIGNEITTIQKKIEDKNGVVVESIEGLGTYIITYTVTDNGQSASIRRTVVVK